MKFISYESSSVMIQFSSITVSTEVMANNFIFSFQTLHTNPSDTHFRLSFFECSFLNLQNFFTLNTRVGLGGNGLIELKVIAEFKTV